MGYSDETWYVGSSGFKYYPCVLLSMHILSTSFAYSDWLITINANIPSPVWAIQWQNLWSICCWEKCLFNVSFAYLFWLANNKKCKYPEFCIGYSDKTWYVGSVEQKCYLRSSLLIFNPWKGIFHQCCFSTLGHFSSMLIFNSWKDVFHQRWFLTFRRTYCFNVDFQPSGGHFSSMLISNPWRDIFIFIPWLKKAVGAFCDSIFPVCGGVYVYMYVPVLLGFCYSGVIWKVEVQLQRNMRQRCNRGFSIWWCRQRSHTKVKGHLRSS